MTSRLTVGLLAGGIAFTTAGGFLASQALSQTDSGKTVTIDLKNGEPGPRGPQGERGPAGPPGGTTCPDGFEFGRLVINHPGGQAVIYTCLTPDSN